MPVNAVTRLARLALAIPTGTHGPVELSGQDRRLPAHSPALGASFVYAVYAVSSPGPSLHTAPLNFRGKYAVAGSLSGPFSLLPLFTRLARLALTIHTIPTHGPIELSA